MLNESLNQFKFDSSHFQHFFYAFNSMLNDQFKRPRHLVQQSVERMLREKMFKPFKGAFKAKCRGRLNKSFNIVERVKSVDSLLKAC